MNALALGVTARKLRNLLPVTQASPSIQQHTRTFEYVYKISIGG
jgi:hypothetical protein